MKAYQVITEVKLTSIINADSSDEAKINAIGVVKDVFPEAWDIKIDTVKEIKR